MKRVPFNDQISSPAHSLISWRDLKNVLTYRHIWLNLALRLTDWNQYGFYKIKKVNNILAKMYAFDIRSVLGNQIKLIKLVLSHTVLSYYIKLFINIPNCQNNAVESILELNFSYIITLNQSISTYLSVV